MQTFVETLDEAQRSMHDAKDIVKRSWFDHQFHVHMDSVTQTAIRQVVFNELKFKKPKSLWD